MLLVECQGATIAQETLVMLSNAQYHLDAAYKKGCRSYQAALQFNKHLSL